MFFYYLKITWRNFRKDGLFSLLNLLGLSVGLASALLIWFWVAAFAYHVSLGVDVFFFTAGAAIGLTLVTVSVQAIKAGLRNPVKSLRAE